MLDILHQIDIVEILSAFIVMFAIIDITGSIPIFIGMEDSGKHIKPLQATGVALGLFVGFFFAGEALLRLFSIDIASFAVAGAIVLFLLALEMIMGREFIKNESAGSGASIVPVAFPLIAGPGALTALLSLRAEYATVNIMLGLLLNIVLDYLVLLFLKRLERWLGNDLVFVLRKFFGVILLAIAIKLFGSNIGVVMQGAGLQAP
ncbi:MAG: MarC family protein [Bacteroidales bacterium]|nr:MarC family protein [Bacteroidales bacterium]